MGRTVQRMNRFVRRGILGALAGSAASTPLLFLTTARGAELALALVAGAIYSACLPPTRGAYADNIMAAASLGIPLWGITSILLLPVISRNQMAMAAVDIQAQFAPLVGWILCGALLGAFLQSFSEIAETLYGVSTRRGEQTAPKFNRRHHLPPA